MQPPYLDRMIRLADEFFATRSDPTQLAVTDDVMTRLRGLHPATLNDHDEGKGPVAWILVIPTTRDIADRFVAGSITERELYEQTLPGAVFASIYLCSALVLPEFRGRGLARGLTLRAIDAIRGDHPIERLCTWAFSREGLHLAESVAKEAGLPLDIRVHQHAGPP